MSDVRAAREVTGPRSSGHWDPVLVRVAIAYVAIAAILLLVVAAATGPGDELAGSKGLGWIQGWARWDSGWYRGIAEDGYAFAHDRQSSVAFFPAYPLLMKVGGMLLPVFLAGYVITLLSGLSACLLFARWCLDRMSRGTAVVAIALLMLYPYSYYLYGAVYADALFLACGLGAFVLLERGNPLLAGLLGIAATAGRPIGVAVAVGLAVRAVELAAQRAPRDESALAAESGRDGASAHLARARAGARHLTWRDASVLLSAAGLAGWCAYLWIAFDNPLAFVTAESAPGWDQGMGVRVWLKFALFERIANGDFAATVGLAAPGLALLAAAALLPQVLRRFGLGYVVYSAIVIGVPLLGTKDFLGVGRYLFVAFPVIAVCGEMLAGIRPAGIRRAVLTASAVGLVVGAAVYGAGFLIA